MESVNNKGVRRLYRVLTWLTALAVIAAALMAIGESLSINLSGNIPRYTVQSAGAAQRRILPAVLAAALLSAATALVGRKAGRSRRPGTMDAQNRLRLMKKGVPAFSNEVKACEGHARTIRTVCGAAVALCLSYPAVYLCRRANFETRDLNGMMLKLMLHTLPGVLLALAAIYIARRLLDKNAEREIALLGALPRTDGAGTAPEERDGKRAKRIFVLRVLIAVLALGLIVWGVFNGSLNDVLKKAIAICTECIGLG